MTNQQHPITPPPELVEQWRNSPEYITGLQPMSMVSLTTDKLQDIATQAARWGSDQELEACCAAEHTVYGKGKADWLRSLRRPKPPSLKEQALGLLNEGPVSELLDHEVEIIRRALEQLDD